MAMKALLLTSAMVFFVLGNGAAQAAIPDLPPALKSHDSATKITLLEFSAPWCITCQMLKPKIASLKQTAGPSLRLVELNIDLPANKVYTQRYHVLATPSIILFDKRGKALKSFQDDVSPDQLRNETLAQLKKQ